MQEPSAKAPSLDWRVLGAGILLGAVLGWLVFFGLPDKAPQQQLIPRLPAAPTAQASAGGILLGSPAPDFELRQTDGEAVRLSEQRGQVVLLNFWATWCVPCRTEMPLLQSTADDYADAGLRVFGIDFDEAPESVDNFAAELSLDFPLLLDPGGSIQELYGVRGYPTTAVIDREGNLAAYHIGVLTESQLKGYLEQAGLSE